MNGAQGSNNRHQSAAGLGADAHATCDLTSPSQGIEFKMWTK